MKLPKGTFRKSLLVYGLILLFGAAVIGCVGFSKSFKSADAYTPINRITLTTMGLAQIADGITTNRGIGAGAVEMNPLLGETPSAGTIAIASVVGIGIKWIAGHLMPAKWRNWFWGGATVLNTGAAIHNNNIYQDIKEK